MKSLILVIATAVAGVSYAENCYDEGKQYKSKSSLRRSKKASFGFKKKCRSVLEKQKKQVFSVANSTRTGNGLEIDSESSTSGQKEPSLWQRLAHLDQENPRNIDFPDLEYFEPIDRQHVRGLMKYGQRKGWRFRVGSPDSFLTEVEPYIGFFASKVEAAGMAGIALHGNLMGRWQGELASFRAIGFSPGTGSLSLDLNLIGPDGAIMWDHNLYDALAIRFNKHLVRRIGVDTKYRFALGPVPMAAEVGVVGSVGVKIGAALFPLQASLWGIPYAAADAYAMAGADVFILGSGVGGSLTLASDELTFRGRSLFEYNEEPRIKIESKTDNKINLLSGDLFAFLYLKIPLLKKKWQGRFTLFDWDGVAFDKSLYHAKLAIGKNGTIAYGDVDGSDAVNLRGLEATTTQQVTPSEVEKVQNFIQQLISNTQTVELEDNSLAQNNRLMAKAVGKGY